MTTETPIDTIGIIGAMPVRRLLAWRYGLVARSGSPTAGASSPWAPWWKRWARRVGRPTDEAAAGAMVVIAVPWASFPTAVAGPA